jgi:cobalt/nickel transport system permease protein
MRHSYLDKHSGLDSPIHRLDPRAKIVSFGTALLLVVSEPSAGLPAFLLYFIAIGLTLAVSRVPLSFVLRRLIIAAPFVIMAALLMLVAGTADSRFGASRATDTRQLLALAILLKATAEVLLLTLLTATERFHRLLHGLRMLRAPHLLGVLSAFMYRYVFILSDELLRTSLARSSRTPGKLRAGRVATYGNQAATIFIRGFDRSHRVYQAMCARGFTGRFPQSDPIRFGAMDAVFMATYALTFVAIRVLA